MESMKGLVVEGPQHPRCNCVPVLAVCAARTLERCSVSAVDELEVASGAAELAVDGAVCRVEVAGDLGVGEAGDE
jgi:hypothetical protein